MEGARAGRAGAALQGGREGRREERRESKKQEESGRNQKKGAAPPHKDPHTASVAKNGQSGPRDDQVSETLKYEPRDPGGGVLMRASLHPGVGGGL